MFHSYHAITFLCSCTGMLTVLTVCPSLLSSVLSLASWDRQVWLTGTQAVQLTTPSDSAQTWLRDMGAPFLPYDMFWRCSPRKNTSLEVEEIWNSPSQSPFSFTAVVGISWGDVEYFKNLRGYIQTGFDNNLIFNRTNCDARSSGAGESKS